MHEINFKIKVKCWKDKATGHQMIYSKKFDISAYGETKAEAKEMFLETVASILENTTAWGEKKK